MMNAKIDEVYDWFKTLDGAKRIDFLNGILHLCFPLELRFIGSCIEELARKDYNYLRDAEVKANTINEVLSMHDISDKVTRSKMIVTLALLNSTNNECARLLYDVLNVDILMILNNLTSINETIADEFLLLFTMATNHPAFDFSMKTSMCDQLKKIEANLNSLQQQHHQQHSTQLQPNYHQLQSLQLQQPQQLYHLNNLISPNLNSNCCSPNPNVQISNNNSNNTQNEANVFIESINFEGVKTIKGTDNYKFIIKIHWSDHSVNEVGKTYSDFCDFHQKLINLFAKDLNGLLDGTDMLMKENQKEDFIKELPLVTEYCNKIVHLPPILSQSTFVTNFFKSDSKENDVDLNKSIQSQNGSTSDNQQQQQQQQAASKRVSTNSSSCGSPGSGLKTTAFTQDTTSQNSNANVNKNDGSKKNALIRELNQVSLSLMSSPCVSPKVRMPLNDSRSNSPAIVDHRQQLQSQPVTSNMNAYPNLVYSPREANSVLDNYLIPNYSFNKTNNQNSNNDEFTQEYDDSHENINDRRDTSRRSYSNTKNVFPNDYYSSTILPDTNNLNQQVITAQFKSKSNSAAHKFHLQQQHMQKNAQFIKQQQQHHQAYSLTMPPSAQQAQYNYATYPTHEAYQAQFFPNNLSRLVYPTLIPTTNPQQQVRAYSQSNSHQTDSKIDLSSNSSSTESNTSSSSPTSQPPQKQQVQLQKTNVSDDENQSRHTKTKIPSAMSGKQVQEQPLSLNGTYIQINQPQLASTSLVPQLSSPLINNLSTTNRSNLINQAGSLPKNMNLIVNNSMNDENNLLSTKIQHHHHRTNIIKPVTGQYSPALPHYTTLSSSSSLLSQQQQQPTSKSVAKTRDKTENHSSSAERNKLTSQKLIKNSDKIANSTHEQYLREFDNNRQQLKNSMTKSDDTTKDQPQRDDRQMQSLNQNDICYMANNPLTNSNNNNSNNGIYMNAYSQADLLNYQAAVAAAYNQQQNQYPTSMSPFYNQQQLVNLISIPVAAAVSSTLNDNSKTQSLDASSNKSQQQQQHQAGQQQRVNSSNEYLFNASQNIIKSSNQHDQQAAANAYNLSYLPQLEAINAAVALTQIPSNIIRNRSHPSNMNHAPTTATATLQHHNQFFHPSLQQLHSQQLPPTTHKNRSCWNCGSSSHFAADCSEPTLENMSQQSQYRLNFKPVNIKNESTLTNNDIKNINKHQQQHQSNLQQHQQQSQPQATQIIEN